MAHLIPVSLDQALDNYTGVLWGILRTEDRVNSAAVSRSDKSFIIIARVQYFLLDTNRRYCPVAPRALDLTGKRFGRLVVVRRAGTSSNGHSMWACDCDCWTTNHVVAANVLRNGFSRSCGCSRREFMVEYGPH
jgi:hypothetical protein